MFLCEITSICVRCDFTEVDFSGFYEQCSVIRHVYMPGRCEDTTDFVVSGRIIRAVAA